jgi:hypothetical protein
VASSFAFEFQIGFANFTAMIASMRLWTAGVVPFPSPFALICAYKWSLFGNIASGFRGGLRFGGRKNMAVPIC